MANGLSRRHLKASGAKIRRRYGSVPRYCDLRFGIMGLSRQVLGRVGTEHNTMSAYVFLFCAHKSLWKLQQAELRWEMGQLNMFYGMKRPPLATDTKLDMHEDRSETKGARKGGETSKLPKRPVDLVMIHLCKFFDLGMA